MKTHHHHSSEHTQPQPGNSMGCGAASLSSRFLPASDRSLWLIITSQMAALTCACDRPEATVEPIGSVPPADVVLIDRNANPVQPAPVTPRPAAEVPSMDDVPMLPFGRANDGVLHTFPVDSSGALEKRAEIVRFIWGTDGFPGARLPESIRTLSESPVGNLVNLETVEALTIAMELDQRTVAYHFVPALRKNHLVVVHHGHACVLDDGPGTGQRDLGIQRTIKALLAEGYGVLAMNMPRMRPGNSELNDAGDCRADHTNVLGLVPTTGHPLKFFLEPVAIGLNALSDRGYFDIGMLGLSGGGWTTTMYAAIDPRVRISIPVAGSIPLYLRVEPYSHDLEQVLPPFYGSFEGSVPGIAGYLDLYLLGAHGNGRKQLQILNRRDDCCFGASQHVESAIGATFDEAVRDYEASLQGALSAMESGSFRVLIDEASRYHTISDAAIRGFILPALRGDSTPTTVRNVWGHKCIDVPVSGRPIESQDALQLHDCHGETNQQFFFHDDGQVRLEGTELCWDAGHSHGEALHLSPCDQGAHQRFVPSGNGTIRHPASGLCLDVEFFSRAPANGDRLRLLECHGGVNQRFSVNRGS